MTPKETTAATASAAASAYRARLFSGVPLFTTRLVRQGAFLFPERERLDSPEAAARLLQAYFQDRDREEFLVCLVDRAATLTGIVCVSVGGLAASIVEARQVFKVALLGNAASVILAHNHVSGSPEPSREDVEVTRRLVEAGRVMEVSVLDHLIITDTGYTSLKDRGLIS